MTRQYEASGAPEHVSDFLNECYEAGIAAGTWVEIESEETATALLQGLNDGDPQVYDALPSPMWSGEWADEPTYESLARDAGLSEDEADDYYGEALIAFSSGVEDEVTRAAKAILS